MNQLSKALTELVSQLKDTSQYREYLREKEKIKAHPELKAQIDDYRKMIYEVQNLTDEKAIYDKMGQFEREYAQFGEEPMVNDFLEAELALCRLIQDIEESITGSLDFE